MKSFSMLSGAVAIVSALAASGLVPATAEPLGGPKYAVHRVEARSTDHFKITFVADEEGVVLVSGDGDTDLDLYVYDENGNLVGVDNDRTDQCIVKFTPKWTGTFRIEVRNLGRVHNRYEIACR